MTDEHTEAENLAFATDALSEIQAFDSESVGRADHLGATLHLEGAVEPVRRLLEEWNRLPVSYLKRMPLKLARSIGEQARGDLVQLHELLEYEVDEGRERRDALLARIAPKAEARWEWLRPWRADSLTTGADFSDLRREARGLVDKAQLEIRSIVDAAGESLTSALEAKEALENLAAESGATMEAVHFKEAADGHDEDAKAYKRSTWQWAIAIVVFAVLAMCASKIFKPEGMEHVQLVVSKLLIFGVLSFMFFQSARSWMAARHNSVVNRHRQSALLSFRALVAAADDPQAKEVILQHAAACIYSPQPTGFTRGGDRSGSSSSIVEVVTSAAKSAADGS